MTSHAFLWDGVMRDLGVDGSTGSALGINDLGQVVGRYNDYTSHTRASGSTAPDGWALTTLAGLADPQDSHAFDINNWGQIVGCSRIITGTLHACLWECIGGEWIPTDLGWLGPADQPSWAKHINDLEQAVGESRIDATTSHACLWERTGDEWIATDLGGLVPSLSSDAHGINDLGQIVGMSRIVTGTWHACLWEYVGGNWIATDLSGLVPSLNSCASHINNSGQVVGYSYTDTISHAFLWDGTLHDLNDFLPAGSGWTLHAASSINEYGLIVGRGKNPLGQFHAFLMDTSTPVYSYTSTGSAVAIRDKASASKAMTLDDDYVTFDLNVAINLTHANYADLKIELIGPKPNNTARVLCNAGSLQGSGAQTIVFDDEGAAGTIQPVQPLSYYDNKSIKRAWTLRITDTVKNGQTGTLFSWTLIVVPQTP